MDQTWLHRAGGLVQSRLAPGLGLLGRGASALRRLSERTAFVGDSLVLLATLLLVNLLRLHFPGAVAEALFAVTVLLMALALLRGRVEAEVRPALLCFGALAALYAVGLAFAFSLQGVRHLAGVLAAGVVFLFCQRHGPAWARSKPAVLVLPAAMLAMLPLYFMDVGLKAHAAALGYLLLALGLVLVVRSEEARRQHWWAHAFFLLFVGNGIVFGHFLLVGGLLLAYPLYWGGRYFLRSRKGAGILAAAVAALACAFVGYFAGPPPGGAEGRLGEEAKAGRANLWGLALAGMAQAPWLGRGPGAVVSTSLEDHACLNDGNPGLVADCKALIRMRRPLAGNSGGLWSWDYAYPIESWLGVTLGGTPLRVTELDLSSSGLNGRVPPKVAQLHQLASLNLAANALSGRIPPALGRMANLQFLALSNNDLSGPIPAELSKLGKLTNLRLDGNRLSGAVPPALGELLELRELALAGNELTGPIAPALRQVAEHDLDQGMLCLSSNAAAGWVGPGLLKDCANLLAARDALAPTGGLNWHVRKPIPSWDGVVLRGTPLRVAELRLQKMNLGGSLPRELSVLEQLEVLNVGYNRLTGAIPPEFGRLANLRRLLLDYNALTGGIPPELGNLKQLEALRLRENRLSGPIPAALEMLPKLRLLHLRMNQFTGAPPLALFNIPNQDLDELLFCMPLETSSAGRVGPGLLKDCGILLAASEALAGADGLNWRRNQPIGLWRGVILGGAPLRVVALHLEGMDLDGRIPEQLGGLEQLVSLRLADNQLTGPVPAEIGNLKNLAVLSLQNNRLLGGVPPQLLALPNLEVFHYVSEDFAGVAPAGRQPDEGDGPAPAPFCMPPSKLNPVSAALFEDCALLLEMRDALAGGAELNWRPSLPISSWRGVALGGVASRVVGLDLHGAGLRGRLPAQLARLGGLESLRLSNNPLAGPIPAELGGLRNLVEFRLGGDAHWEKGKFFCLPLPPTNSDLLKDCTALLAVRDLLAGDANLNWRKSTHLGAWEGVTAEGTPLRVTELELPKRGLRGRLPAGLAALHQLRVLDLHRNRLRGSIPAELANLANLRILRLHGNGLTGPIPSELGRLAELRHLILNQNQLGGAVPAELGELFNLESLRLYGNRFAGAVPPALRQVPFHDLDHGLLCLSASEAAFQAVPPALLGDCALLLEVRDALAGGVNLNWRGSVPIGLWQGVKLGGAPVRVQGLELDGMGLNGRLPPEFGRLTGLRTLSLERNALTGPIPPEFGKLSNLRTLRLRDNQLSGPIAPQLQGLERLSLLRLSGNDFTAPVPEAWRRLADSDLDDRSTCPLVPRSNLGLVDDCANLLAIRDVLAGSAVLDWDEATPMAAWHGVALQGDPPRVVSLGAGWRPQLLDGRIPAELGRLEQLVALYLGEQNLQGAIPAALGKLSNLKHLYLNNNSLTGPIPAELGNLGNLELLYLQHNSLTGPIPAELGRLAGLTNLDLCGNSLTGPIPTKLGALGNLEQLFLCHNALTGTIPTELGNLGSLRRLALHYNRLSGAVPPTIATLPQLRLDGNALSGNFPPPPSLDGSRGPDAEALVTKALASATVQGEDGAAQMCRPASNRPPASGLQKDCAILLEARDLLTGGVALNWRSSTPVGLWRGVALRGKPPRIIALDLANMGLRGVIPAQLGGLDQLVSLRLQRNALKGAIPAELGGLANLRERMLYGNALTGAVPSESESLQEPAPKGQPDDQPNRASRNGATCGQAPGLRMDCATLLAVKDELAGNADLNWSEALPVNAWRGVWAGGDSLRIMALDLPSAGLDGRIPQGLAELERLASLQLSGNRLTGPIPAQLGDLPNLELLRLSNNRLSGAIPPQLGKLAALRKLALDGNQLTGGIPMELTELTALEELRLANNKLSGSPPPQLASLENLALLRLGGNAFLGCLPPALKGAGDARLEEDLACEPSPWARPPLLEDAAVLTAVRDILAGGAELNWSYDEPIASWRGVSVAGAPLRVVAIDLSGAGLNGRIPAELGTLRQLSWLRLNNNRLTGAIPPELSWLTNLRELALQGNALTGAIPPELQHLANLEELRLGGNRLSGAVPPELGRLGALEALQLGGNAFAGCFPEALRRFGANLHLALGLPFCGEEAQGEEAAGIDAAVNALSGLFGPAAEVETAESARNLFLQVGLQTGVLGLLTAALLCASLIFSVRSRTGGLVSPVQRFVATCIVMIIIHNLFAVYLLQNSHGVGIYSWILIGMGVGLAARSPNEAPA